MKLSDLKVGDIIIADDGFTCMKAGPHTVHATDDGDLFVWCKGPEDEVGNFPYAPTHHLLEGQEDEPGGELVGLSRAP